MKLSPQRVSFSEPRPSDDQIPCRIQFAVAADLQSLLKTRFEVTDRSQLCINQVTKFVQHFLGTVFAADSIADHLLQKGWAQKSSWRHLNSLNKNTMQSANRDIVLHRAKGLQSIAGAGQAQVGHGPWSWQDIKTPNVVSCEPLK